MEKKLRGLIFIFLMISFLLPFPANSSEMDFDSELSDAILFENHHPEIVQKINSIQIFDFGQDDFWPLLSELDSEKKIFETNNHKEIVLLVNALRNHGENIRSEPLKAIFGILFKMKDVKFAYVKIRIHETGVFLVSYPSKKEFGVIGYPNNIFLDYLKQIHFKKK